MDNGNTLTNKYCWDARHNVPCPLPCDACEEECNLEDRADTPTNQLRTAEWDVRHWPTGKDIGHDQ